MILYIHVHVQHVLLKVQLMYSRSQKMFPTSCAMQCNGVNTLNIMFSRYRNFHAVLNFVFSDKVESEPIKTLYICTNHPVISANTMSDLYIHVGEQKENIWRQFGFIL